MARVSVYNNGVVIASVEYNNNLDTWNNGNWNCGSPGRHKGLTRLKNGSYVLIRGTQWQNERDSAEIISANQALQEILQAGVYELFNEPMFEELKELYEKNVANEWSK